MASYEAGRNYTREIEAAIKNEDYKLAGQLEQERNAKIEGEGLNYQKTQDLGSAYDQQYMTNEELGNAYKMRQAAKNNGGSSQGAHNYVESIRKNYGYSGGKYGNDFIPLEEEFSYESAPQYTNKYSDKIAELRDDILGREAFTYDYNTDPLYAQYAESYTRGGDRAMQDTLGQMAARTGGLASSYADTVGQQQYNNYMAALADKVPELQQLAYSMYQDEGDRQRMNLEMLRALENDDYEKYLTLLNQYNVDRAFAYGVFGDQRAYDYNKSIDQRNYDYQLSRDAVNDYWTRTQWDYGVGRDALSDQNNAYDRLATLITGYGYQPSEAELEAAGMPASVYQALYSSWLAGSMVGSGSGGSGGSRRSSGGGGGGGGSLDLYQDMLDSGNPWLFLSQNYKKYGVAYNTINSVYAEYESWLKNQGTDQPGYLNSLIDSSVDRSAGWRTSPITGTKSDYNPSYYDSSVDRGLEIAGILRSRGVDVDSDLLSADEWEKAKRK